MPGTSGRIDWVSAARHGLAAVLGHDLVEARKAVVGHATAALEAASTTSSSTSPSSGDVLA